MARASKIQRMLIASICVERHYQWGHWVNSAEATELDSRILD
jgi:hypothetical protein